MDRKDEPLAQRQQVEEPVLTPSGLVLPDRRVDLIWAAIMLGLVVFVFATLSLVQRVAVPVLLALAMAYALNPVVNWLSARRVGRGVGTVLVLAVLFLGIAGFVVYLIPVVREQADKVPAFLKAASIKAIPWIERALGVKAPDVLHERAIELGGRAADMLEGAAPTAARWLTSVASNTVVLLTTFLTLLLVPVLAFFFLADYPALVRRVRVLIPRRAETQVVARFSEVDDVLSAFIRGQLTVGAVLTVIYSVGFSAAGLDLALVLGFLTGFGNMVPYVGTGVGAALSALALTLSWEGPHQVLVLALTFVVAQTLEGLVITPRIVGRKVGLPAVAIIVAVLAFGQVFHFLGVLLAVPTTAVLKVVFRVLLRHYRESAFYLAQDT